MALLQNPPAHSIAIPSLPDCHPLSLLVADTGATDHMLPDKSAFISYRPVVYRWVRMGDNSFAPILGTGFVVIAVNGKCILIQDCLHVPALRNPLYSVHAHQWQHGCSFLGMHNLGIYVFFPTLIVKVDTATDCHLSYKPIGHSGKLPSLDYVQPKMLPHQHPTPHQCLLRLWLLKMIRMQMTSYLSPTLVTGQSNLRCSFSSVRPLPHLTSLLFSQPQRSYTG